MGNGIKVRFFRVGHCVHPGRMVGQNLSFEPIEFPAMAALIVHPERGNIIFDTGYHRRFAEVTKKFPESLYPKVTPFVLNEGETFRDQLNSIGVKKIQYAILSHFHADHLAGLCEFTEAEVICHKEEYSAFRHHNRFIATRYGYLSQLFPQNLSKPMRFIEEVDHDLAIVLGLTATKSNIYVYDLFGDKTIYLVHLPGHTKGQLGMIIRLSGRFLFLIADACWLIDNLQSCVDPHWMAGFINQKRSAYWQTLGRLRKIFSECKDDVTFVPSHCQRTLKTLVDEQWIF